MSASQRISMTVQCFSGCALEWAAATWHARWALATDYETFVQEFKDVFDHPDQRKSSSQKLLHVHQGSSSVADYSIQFRILATDRGWNQPALLAQFRDGLNPMVQLKLTCKDMGLDHSACISMAIKLVQYPCGQGCVPQATSPGRRQSSRGPPVTTALGRRTSSPEPDAHEPMALRSSSLSAQEWRRRIDNGLCLYCIEAGHH